MTEIALTRLLEMILLPPGGPLLLVLALLIPGTRTRMRTLLLGLGIVTLYLSATPFVTSILTAGLEPNWAPITFPTRPGAIVILGGPDASFDAAEYGGDTAGPMMLSRLRYGAKLHRDTRLPIAVIGGDALGRGSPASLYMKAILENEFKVPVYWQDGRSKHTADNARYAAELLAAHGISHIYLVTHSWHMRRARALFERSGLRVTPAPTAFTTQGPLEQGMLALIPRADAISANNRALHEWIGLAVAWAWQPR